MTTQTTSTNALTVARSRWNEASRVTDAFKTQKAIRLRRAYQLKGRPGELQAWADVAEVEDQLEAQEAAEVRAWQEVAWLEAAVVPRKRNRRG